MDTRTFEGIPYQLTALTRLLGCVVNFIPAGLMMIGLYTLAKLFALYEKGCIFTQKNVACYRILGRLIICGVFIGVVYRTVLILALTLFNPPGQRILSIGFGTKEIEILLIGIIVLIITWVMEEGRMIENEQALTV